MKIKFSTVFGFPSACSVSCLYTINKTRIIPIKNREEKKKKKKKISKKKKKKKKKKNVYLSNKEVLV